MVLSSDLAGVFQIILAQQEAEARKEERQQDIALNLLSMELNIEQKEMDRQVTLLDRQIARNEKRYDTVLEDFQTTKKDYEETTGLIYKLPDQERGDDAIGVLNDIKGGTADSLSALLTDIKTDTRDMQSAKSDMESQLGQSKLISDFYEGYGHDMSKGDPERWDAPDFGEEALAEYIAQYPELEGVDQEAFYKGVKTREEAGLFQNIQNLNIVLHKTQVAELDASIKQMNYDTKAANITVAQIEADVDNIDSGVHKMTGAHAESLNSTLYAPAIQSVLEFTESKTPSIPEGDADLEEEQNSRLEEIGSIVTGDPASIEENRRLGKVLVLSNSNYINSVPGYLKGSGELDYVGYVNGLQEIQMYAEQARRALDDNLISTEDYLVYKSGLEELIGTDLNTFNIDMDVLLQASDSKEDYGKDIAIAGMKESYIESEQKFDYNIPYDYTVPFESLPGVNQLLPIDSSNVTIDSLNLIPENIDVVPEDTTQDTLSVFNTLFPEYEEAFGETGKVITDFEKIKAAHTMANLTEKTEGAAKYLSDYRGVSSEKLKGKYIAEQWNSEEDSYEMSYFDWIIEEINAENLYLPISYGGKITQRGKIDPRKSK